MLQRFLQRFNNIVDPHPYDGFLGSRIFDQRPWLEKVRSSRNVITLPTPLRADAHTACLVRTYALPSGAELYLWSSVPDTIEDNLLVPAGKWMATHVPMTLKVFDMYLKENPSAGNLPIKWKRLHNFPEYISLPHRAKDFEEILTYLIQHPPPKPPGFKPSQPR